MSCSGQGIWAFRSIGGSYTFSGATNVLCPWIIMTAIFARRGKPSLLLDLTLLSLGEDGHIASLFPGTKALDERNALVTSTIGAKPEPRISLTYPAPESSGVILFVVSGAKKRDILARVLANDLTLPASRLSSGGIIRVFADRAALPV